MNIPSLTPLLYGFSVYSCHLFLVFSASVRSLTVSALYHAHLCMKHSLDISYFLTSSLVFPIILFSSVFLYCSLKEAFLSLLAILLYLHSGGYIFPFLPWLLLLFFTQLFVKHYMVWLTEFHKPLHHNKTVIHEGNSDNYHIPISTRKHIYFPSISCGYFCFDFFLSLPQSGFTLWSKMAQNRSVLRTNNFEIMADRDCVW